MSLSERIKLNLLVNGNDIADNFKNNSLFFYNKFTKSDEYVTNIKIENMQPGCFYFLHYKDDSNWMRYAPIFMVDYKKLSNKNIILGINFNFIPIEIRAHLFENFITEENFTENKPLLVDYQGVYNELLKYGYEYGLMEFNAIQIVLTHKIHLELLPRFLYSQHPKNIYDPNKLNAIWEAKLTTRHIRHKEMLLASLNEFYDVTGAISDKYISLKSHIERIQKSMNKYS